MEDAGPLPCLPEAPGVVSAASALTVTVGLAGLASAANTVTSLPGKVPACGAAYR